MDKQEKGFSLIEVMVALVILVVGLIGIFNLHTVAKQSGFESFQQTQAAYLAADIVSRMKLNKPQLTSYAGTYSGNLTLPGKKCDVTAGATVICTNIETRDWDKYHWEQLLLGSTEAAGGQKVGGLDSPTACVGVAAGGDVTVVITWRGIRQSSDGAAANTNPFVKNCGTASDMRRVYVLRTVII